MNLCLVYIGVLQYVRAHLSAKLESSEEAYRKVDIISLLTSKGLISQEGLLDFGNGEYVVFYLLSGQAQPLLFFSYNLHLGVWVQLFTLEPIYLLSQDFQQYVEREWRKWAYLSCF